MKRYALMLALLLMPSAASAEWVRTPEGETWVYPYVLSAYSSGGSVTVSVNTAAPPVVATFAIVHDDDGARRTSPLRNSDLRKRAGPSLLKPVPIGLPELGGAGGAPRIAIGHPLSRDGGSRYQPALSSISLSIAPWVFGFSLSHAFASRTPYPERSACSGSAFGWRAVAIPSST